MAENQNPFAQHDYFTDAQVPTSPVIPQNTAAGNSGAIQTASEWQNETTYGNGNNVTARNNASSNMMRALIENALWYLTLLVAVISVAAGCYMYVTDSIPASFYTQESPLSYEQHVADKTLIEDNEYILDFPEDAGYAELTDEQIAALEDSIEKSKANIEQSNTLARDAMIFKVGVVPYVLLFVAWLVFSRINKSAGIENARRGSLVKRCLLFALGGVAWFMFIPKIVCAIATNIVMIVLLVIFLVIVVCAVGGAGGVASSATSGINGGATSRNQGSGRRDASSNANDKQPKRVKVHSSAWLTIEEDMMHGRHIHARDGITMDCFVCTKYDYDRGNVVIVDEKGRVRRV